MRYENDKNVRVRLSPLLFKGIAHAGQLELAQVERQTRCRADVGGDIKQDKWLGNGSVGLISDAGSCLLAACYGSRPKIGAIAPLFWGAALSHGGNLVLRNVRLL
ncbi:hypothetical protein MELB17_03280 [Marinobacter sp. ELB17]|nr:hypothetical protein MELB17_03280 [Marinobacter sp. ELB17]